MFIQIQKQGQEKEFETCINVRILYILNKLNMKMVFKL